MNTIRWLEAQKVTAPAPGAGDTVECREFEVSRDDQIVPGVLWQGEACRAGSPMVLLGHGASGDRHQSPIPYLSQRLAAKGIFCVAIDGPVHGKRRQGDGGRGAFGEWWRRPGGIAAMNSDWQAAIDLVRDETGAGTLGYWGLSMGTILGAPLVAATKAIEVAVLGLMGTVGPTDEYKQLIQESAANITCPVFFIMQLEDELFARDRYLDLFDLIASTDKRLHANPGLHPEVPEEELVFSIDFLVRHLTDAGVTTGGAASISE